jgi:hypothetical protein
MAGRWHDPDGKCKCGRGGAPTTLRALDGAAAIAGVTNGILWGEVVGDCDATTFFVRANHATNAFPHKTHVA